MTIVQTVAVVNRRSIEHVHSRSVAAAKHAWTMDASLCRSCPKAGERRVHGLGPRYANRGIRCPVYEGGCWRIRFQRPMGRWVEEVDMFRLGEGVRGLAAGKCKVMEYTVHNRHTLFWNNRE